MAAEEASASTGEASLAAERTDQGRESFTEATTRIWKATAEAEMKGTMSYSDGADGGHEQPLHPLVAGTWMDGLV